MKLIDRFKAFLAITLMLPFTCLVVSAEKNQVVSVVGEHWPPWLIAYDSQKQQVTAGLAVEIAQELLTRLNLEMKFNTRPWPRALMEIEDGRSDLVLYP